MSAQHWGKQTYPPGHTDRNTDLPYLYDIRHPLQKAEKRTGEKKGEICMKNTMREGCDRECMVNTFTTTSSIYLFSANAE